MLPPFHRTCIIPPIMKKRRIDAIYFTASCLGDLVVNLFNMERRDL
jgi:hypothetical protein